MHLKVQVPLDFLIQVLLKFKRSKNASSTFFIHSYQKINTSQNFSRSNVWCVYYQLIILDFTLLPPLLSVRHNLVLDMKIIMKSMENLRVRREWQSILGNRSQFYFPASVEGRKLNFKIQKGRMLAGLIPVWDILHKKIEAEFEL